MKERKITITEVSYDDGEVLYSVEQEREDGTTENIGMHDETEAIAVILYMMGVCTMPRFFEKEKLPTK